MGGFILFLLLIIIFVVLFIFSAGLSILRGIFRIFTGYKGNDDQRKGGNPFFGNDEKNDSTKTNNGEKIFRKDEGEYVDFVEYKDEEPEKP
ncbi:MAG: hypothetical protein H6Q14_1661 [Bacteroidetes bacterium]|nr:hypothetical protein [Bacteroidota bacterium]